MYLKIIIIGLIFNFSYHQISAESSSPKISITPISFELGTVSYLHLVQHVFILANDGQADLIITDVSTSCSCTTITLSPATIPPGGRIEFTVTYDPKGRTGPFKDYVIITSNDPTHPVQRIKISGVIVADDAASIAPAEFTDNAPTTNPPQSPSPLNVPIERSSDSRSPAYSMVNPELTPGPRPHPLFEKKGSRGMSYVLFFHSPTCPDCAYIKNVFLPTFCKKVGRDLVIKEYDLTSLANYGKLLSLEKQLGRKIDKTPPLIVVGRTVLQGRRAIMEGLDQAIKSAQNNTPIDMPHTPDPSQTPLRNLGLLAVVAGGLVDGINPCAFTTLIFLLSCLALAAGKGGSSPSPGRSSPPGSSSPTSSWA